MRQATYHETDELAYPVTVVDIDYDDGLAYINAGGVVDMVVRIERLDFTDEVATVTAYELEKAMDEDYPMVFNGGEVGEFIPYRPGTSDGDFPF